MNNKLNIIQTKCWFKLALISFLLTTILGLILRYGQIQSLPYIDFKHILHAHSHLGMMGWLFSAYFVLFYMLFVPSSATTKHYGRMFWTIQVSVLGMLITFPIQGYGLYSIIFSTLHMFAAYWFIYKIYKDTSHQQSMSFKFLRWALFWMVLSTFGIWVLGPFIGIFGRDSQWYHLAIQFFLHFQFNGWFVFGAIALFLKWLENRGVQLKTVPFKIILKLLIVSCLLTFFLVISHGFDRFPGLRFIQLLGVFIQIIAVFLLFRYLIKFKFDKALNAGKFVQSLLLIAGIGFIIKALAQVVMVFVLQYDLLTMNRYIVIGFIHLLLLGTISLFIIGNAFHLKLLKISTPQRIAWTIFILGFVGTETLLFIQGSIGMLQWHIPAFTNWLFWLSVLMVVGVFISLVDATRETTTKKGTTFP